MSSQGSFDKKDLGQKVELESQTHTVEKRATRHGLAGLLDVEAGEVYKTHPEAHSKWYQKLLDAGVEENGIKPIPTEHRTNTKYTDLFTVFFTCLLCLLPIPTGMLATLAFGMSLRDASLVILFFSLLTISAPAFMAIGGYKTGLRQLVQARYSFGLYLVTIPLILNAATVTGFSLMSAIVGGQTLAAVNPGQVSVNVGIVITCLVSFAASLAGYRALHFWERYQWIPNLIAIAIAVGCGGKHLHKQQEVPESTANQVLGYGGLIAGYFITFGGTVSDFSTYHDPRCSKRKVFAYVFLGMFIPSTPLLILGAAIGGAVPNVPEWQEAYEASGIGGVMASMLSVAGGFGKFVTVVLALSVIGNIAISMYSVALNLQMLVKYFTRVPRFAFITLTTAAMIPMAIFAAKSWEHSLENFLGMIGYWAGCFDAVIIEELVIFRKMDWESYDHKIWNVGRKLPTGIAAMGACVVSWALVVPGMDATWYSGPIGKSIGDIGFEVAFLVTALVYVPFRWLEIKIMGRV